MRFDLRSRPGRYAAALAVVVLGFTAAPAATAAPAQARPTSGTALEWGFEGISCTASSACTAAGYQETSTGTTETLAEAWNGTSWTVQTTPNPSGTTITADTATTSG